MSLSTAVIKPLCSRSLSGSSFSGVQMARPHQYWQQEDPSQFTSSTGHEAPPLTLVLNLQDKGSWGSWFSSLCQGLFMATHPMVAVFPRMQCPREVYQLNLPGSREAAADFLINTPWSRMPLCKFLEEIPKSLLQATRPRVRLEVSGVEEDFCS